MPHTIHHAALADMSPLTLYAILKLRVDVFVVEQDCPYPDLDGADTAPGTLQVWAADGDGRVLATSRILDAPGGGRRIGRVCADPTARRSGTASAMMEAAMGLCGAGTRIDIDAQAHLEGWYERFGFVRSGADFLEDNIPHIPMRRLPDAGARA
ncbi:ElaA protein [Sanguibacter gelidistatuariae]|uniref:ElaA protein n=1 Tax=Sanguibacter gelidistatuariae TaxID=1814289 RepID=A0A1G6UYT1_9MICO|nr:GNAT family N-acetyltransferase [Sanguibacter gelidistatuariae]SDD46413.1 ElaA protein [Sanguibacter gelidistatuariae]